jgi:transposase
MAKTRRAYAPEFRRQMVELVQAGRSPEALAREFEPTAQSIRNWVAQAERDPGGGNGGLTTAEREELNRLRRENRQLRLEREILSKACPCESGGRRPGSLGRRTRSLGRVPVRERSPGRLSDHHDVPAAGRLLQRLSCVGEAAAVAAVGDRRRADRGDPCCACRLARHLRRAAHSRRACGQGHSYRPQAGRPADDAAPDLIRGGAGSSPPRSRATAVRRRTWSSATSRQQRPTCCGSPISPTSRPGRAFSISPSCSTPSAVASSAGRWPPRWPNNWCSMP